jgi:hypothetical protein
MTIAFLHILRFPILVASQFVKLPFLILHFLWKKKYSQVFRAIHRCTDSMWKNWMKKNQNGFGHAFLHRVGRLPKLWLVMNWNPTENCFLTTYHSSFMVRWWGAGALGLSQV